MRRIAIILVLLVCPALLWAQSYAPTYGINMTAAGARETFQPSAYFITDSANFAYRTSTGSCTTVSGVPALLAIIYEPCFENSASTTVFDAFDVPLKIVNIHDPNASLTDPTNTKISCYPTQSRCMTDDAVYGMGDVNGNTVVRNLTTGALTRGSFVCGTSNGASRWLMGPHKYVLLCLEGSNIILYKASTDRYCTALSVDGTSDTCNATSKTTYHAAPMPGTFGIGGNEGGCQPGANGTAQCPLVKTGAPTDVRLYDVVAKTTVEMADEPFADIDHCEPSPDATLMGCQTNAGNWYVWNASTGAIQNGGSAIGNVGHAGYGQLTDGTNIITTFNDPSFCTGAFVGIQRKGRRTWIATTFTNLLEHQTGRNTVTSCSDSHFSNFASSTDISAPPSVSNALVHRLSVFDVDGGTSGSNVSTTGNYSNWREMTEAVVVCDYDNASSDIINTPNCWKIAHSRRYTRDNCQSGSACVNISRDGTKAMWTWDIGSGSNRRILSVMATIREAGTTPTLSGVTPNNGDQGDTLLSANFAGTNMSGANPVLTITGTGVTFASLVQTSSTLVEANIIIDLAATPTGARNVQFCTDDGCSGTTVFTVNAAAAAPTLSSVACPTTASGYRGAQITCTFIGTDLDGANPALASSCSDVTFPVVTPVNATTITAQVLIGGTQSDGTVMCNFSVSTDDGTSENRTFTVNVPSRPIGTPVIVTIALAPVPTLTISNPDQVTDPFCATVTAMDCIFEARLLVGSAVVQSILASAFVNGSATVSFTTGPRYGDVNVSARFAARGSDGKVYESADSVPIIVPKRPSPPSIRT